MPCRCIALRCGLRSGPLYADSAAASGGGSELVERIPAGAAGIFQCSAVASSWLGPPIPFYRGASPRLFHTVHAIALPSDWSPCRLDSGPAIAPAHRPLPPEAAGCSFAMGWSQYGQWGGADGPHSGFCSSCNLPPYLDLPPPCPTPFLSLSFRSFFHRTAQVARRGSMRGWIFVWNVRNPSSLSTHRAAKCVPSPSMAWRVNLSVQIAVGLRFTLSAPCRLCAVAVSYAS